MRLDKFLKVSRIIKRRTVAKEICANGRVQINGKTAKAGAEVEAGDTLRIELGRKTLEVVVNSTPATVKAEDAQTLYDIISMEERERTDPFEEA